MIALFLGSTRYHSITNQHAKAILKRFDHSTIYLLIAGGLSYPLGAAFYAAKQYRCTHAIWHLFVLGGAACHCVAIAAYVIPSA